MFEVTYNVVMMMFGDPLGAAVRGVLECWPKEADRDWNELRMKRAGSELEG